MATQQAMWEKVGRIGQRAGINVHSQSNGESHSGAEKLARSIGWLNIGMGLAQVAAPRSIGKIVGVKGKGTAVRALGIREITHGIATLSRPNSTRWAWSRVGGGILDLAFLGASLRSRRTNRTRAIAAMGAVAGVTALDAKCALGLGESARSREGIVLVRTSVIVNRSREECYRFWRNFENLPQFMNHLESVRITGERRSHWVARTPGGARIEWDGELVEDRPNEKISWHSLPGAQVPNSGSVHFEEAPGRRGSIIRVQFSYGDTGVTIASAFARLLGRDPRQMVAKDLRRFKQVLETGEVLRTEGQPAGRSRGATWLDDLAR